MFIDGMIIITIVFVIVHTISMERNAITDASVPYLIELMQAAKKLKTLK